MPSHINARSIELYDLSRLLDRVHAIEEELNDFAVTTTAGHVDAELRKAALDVLTALEPLHYLVKAKIGDPADYREEAVDAA